MLDLVMRLKFNPSECDDCCDLTSSSFEPSCVCCFLLQVASSNEQIAQQDTGKPYYLSNSACSEMSTFQLSKFQVGNSDC
jgi:hypothetical protein